MSEVRQRKNSQSTISVKSIHEDKKFKLKQEIGLFTAVAIIGGSLIGSGIFMTPGKILGAVESVGAMFLIWVLAAFIALCCALSYVELALCVRESGGEYAFCLRAYGDWFGFLTAWVSVVISKPGSLLMVTYTFSEYFIKLFYPSPCEVSDSLLKMVAAVFILIVTLLNLWSIRVTTATIQIFWYAKVFALTVVCIAGLVQVANGNTANFANAFEGSSTSWTSYSVALYTGMWSYDGWNQLAFVTEELKEPNKNFPRAIWIAIPLVTLIYILANVAYLSVMTPTEIITGSAVAVTFAYRTLGAFSWIVPVGVVCSTFGTAMGSMFTAARISNVASRRSHLPKIMSYIDTIRYTPSLAILVNTIISLIFILPDASSFSTVLDYFSFISWMIYGLSCFAVIVLRYKSPYKNLDRPYRVPTIIPIFAGLASFYLVVAPLIEEPNIGYAIVLVIALAGFIFYIPIHVYKVQWMDAWMNSITLNLQKILQLAPAEVDFEN